MRINIICSLFFFLSGIYGCTSHKVEESDENTEKTINSDQEVRVKVVTLQPTEFHHELISNGKVTACNFASLRFNTNEMISDIWVKNGDKVKKGQKIAQLDKFRLTNKLHQAADELERTKLEFQDVLIGQGYSLKEEENIPQETKTLARVKSGYDRALYNYELAQYELDNSILLAPFNGVIANLFTKAHNLANTTEIFCSVIDQDCLEINFTILESELQWVKKGDKVKVTPFSDNNLHIHGSILEINPQIDTNGIVKVKAIVNNNSKLIEGMNVRVLIQTAGKKELVVPKSAVVLRSGKQVIFTYKEGKAYWNYVKTGLENEQQYTLTEGLEAGDTIIYSGNINLAHQTIVAIENK